MTKSTCIIIDDEKLARDLLREYLESMEDIELLDECAKGSEAVEKINKLKPDLIFLDVQMPGMTGFEVLDEIDHEPYVIFITAYDQYAIRAFEKNAVDYLLKPLDEDRFRQAVTRALKRKKMEEGGLENLLGSLRQVNHKGSYDSHIFVHRSTIVNVNYLKEIERHFNGGMVVKMQSGKSFPVSRTYAKQIRKKVV
jgi:two-component system LytT family response regulator